MPEISRFYGIIIKMYFLSNDHMKEWLLIHKKELYGIWLTQEFKKIEPLK